MSDHAFILDSMNYSFSCLNSFWHCPYGWYLQYILKQKSCGNFFSDYGSLMHEMLEMYAKDELTIFDLNDYYESGFAKIQNDPPKNKFVDLRESYYALGLDYINNIDLDIDKYDVLGVEKKIKIELFGKKFVGYIDLLLRDKETKEIIVLDHKSRKIKRLKNGELNKETLEAVEEYKRQLYLYAYAVKEEFGMYPTKLTWNHFNSRDWNTVPFLQEEMDATLEWVDTTLKAIYDEVKFAPENSNVFFCNNLCGQRNNGCDYKLHH